MQSIIVFCESEADVVACLSFLQKWDLDLAVAGGRHTYSGASSTAGFVIGKFYSKSEKPLMLTYFRLAQNERGNA
jgi:hypothetical protein